MGSPEQRVRFFHKQVKSSSCILVITLFIFLERRTMAIVIILVKLVSAIAMFPSCHRCIIFAQFLSI